MKFKRILKRKVYPTWVSTRKIKGCSAYVFQVVKNDPEQSYYHFQIVCSEDIRYASLVDNVKFDNFGECCKAAEQWIKNNQK